jgi:hypothetical protein
MNKIILSGVRNLATEEIPKPNTDYLITLIGSLKGKYTPETFDDSEQNEISYYLQIEKIEKLIDLKTDKEVILEEKKNKKEYTPSQKLRFAITANLGEMDYEPFMKFLMSKIDGLIEDYKEKHLS